MVVDPVRAWLLAAALILGLTIAASSDSVRVWTNPEPSDAEPPAVVDRDDTPARTIDEPGERAEYPWLGAILQVLAIGMFAVIAIGGAFTLVQVRPSIRGWRRSSPDRRGVEFAEPLPDSVDQPVQVDVEAGRASLSRGAPRNAIVACWMQLERDVAAAGLPREPAETSGEYVQRVIGRSSVDAAPITELAALYREARFSVHELGDEQRDRALDAFDRVVAALRTEVSA